MHLPRRLKIAILIAVTKVLTGKGFKIPRHFNRLALWPHGIEAALKRSMRRLLLFGFGVLSLYSSGMRAQTRCEDLLESAAKLSAEDTAAFKKGQLEIGRSLYELYLRRPDFRLQTLEVPGISIKIEDNVQAFRYKNTFASEGAKLAQFDDVSPWRQFSRYADWRRSRGSSRVFKRMQRPAYYDNSPVPTKTFGLPDLDFEGSLQSGFSPLRFPTMLKEKYPQLFLSRNRVEGMTTYEQTWNLAYQNLMHYLHALLKQPLAERKLQLTPEQWSILEKVYAKRGSISQLRFVSGKSQPKVFTAQDAAHRLAVTGDKLGDDILINTDFDGSIDLTTATGLLLHELSHLHGYKDTAERPLDKIAASFADHIRQTSEVKSIKGPLGENIQLILLRPTMMNEGMLNKKLSHLDAWGSRVIINDGRYLWDVTSELLASIPDLGVEKLSFFTLKDFDMDLRVMPESDSKRQGYTANFDLHIVRTKERGVRHAERLKTFMSFYVSKDSKNPGIIQWPGLQVSVFPKAFLPSAFERGPKELTAKVVRNQVATPTVTAGTSLKLQAIVEIPEGESVTSAWLDLSSNRLRSVIGAMPNQDVQITNETGRVRVTPLSKTQVQVDAELPITSFTAEQELTLERVNLFYAGGNYSYSVPKFKEKVRVVAATPAGAMSVENLKLGGGKILWPDPRINLNMYSGSPAEVTLTLKDAGYFSHAILVGEVTRIDSKGVASREGFVHNFAAGAGYAVSGIDVQAATGATSSLPGALSNQSLAFAVSTQPQVWGVNAKQVHIQGLYIRDVNLREIYIPFGTNFSIFLEQ